MDEPEKTETRNDTSCLRSLLRWLALTKNQADDVFHAFLVVLKQAIYFKEDPKSTYFCLLPINSIDFVGLIKSG